MASKSNTPPVKSSAATTSRPQPTPLPTDPGRPSLDRRRSFGPPHGPQRPQATPEPLLRIPDKKTIAKKQHLFTPSPLVLPPAVTAEAEIVSPISRTPSPPPSVLVAVAPPNHATVFLAAPQLPIGACDSAVEAIAALAIAPQSDEGEVEEKACHATGTPIATPSGTATASIAAALSMASVSSGIPAPCGPSAPPAPCGPPAPTAPSSTSSGPMEHLRRHSFPSVEPVRP
ncbi:hypothetical protein CspeluHIS016_0208200 [Cutaneotrichosporon spelunceum]|uniref:Uncharacterized protein n=1 Tax=Cutaneotrichosporon spelunceum TaxID=1672016 RepID=A0AAD3YBG7_9TREE|nr:hypothetical protein CspeluHIS016_0208200 [Cutaneotrichosporon spelunceum]